MESVGNRMLLWHGSRLSNWAGILSQGLRIAPPEAPVTGYMVSPTLPQLIQSYSQRNAFVADKLLPQTLSFRA